jgi:hypothetical protein
MSRKVLFPPESLTPLRSFPKLAARPRNSTVHAILLYSFTPMRLTFPMRSPRKRLRCFPTAPLPAFVTCRLARAKSRPLFSWAYESLFSQVHYFDNLPNCPGVSPSPRSLRFGRSASSIISLVESIGYGNIGTKFFRIRSYEKCARNSFKIRSYKKHRGVGVPSRLLPPHRFSVRVAKVSAAQPADTSPATWDNLAHPMSIARSGVHVHG